MGSRKRIICIVGLPGSGKTLLGSKMSSELKCPFVDDCFRPEDMKKLKKEITTNNVVIISAPHFCEEKTRRNVEVILKKICQDPKIEWIFFENDKQQCLINVERRNDGRNVTPTIERLSKNYFPPSNSTIKEVYNGAKKQE